MTINGNHRMARRAGVNPGPVQKGTGTLENHVARDLLGMTEPELYGYLNDLLHEEAAEAAEASGKSVDQELASPGFAAAGAASTYAIKLIMANNAFLTRQLLDLGVIDASNGGDEE